MTQADSFVVSVEPIGRRFTCPAGSTLLAAATSNGIGLPNSCRGGDCRTCLSQLHAGRVRHDPGAALSDEERAAGRLLPCVARPLSDVVLATPGAYELGDIRPRRFPARVLRIDRMAGDVARLTLQVPASLGFRFVPGQYVDVLLGDGQRRSYSIANDPEAAHTMELHLRWMPGGLFTHRVFTTLRPREMLQLDGPHGSFFIRQAAPQKTLLLASGTGFAPIRAMLLDLFAKGDMRPVHLYWGGRRPHDIYALDEVVGWTRRHPSLGFTPVCSDLDAADRWSGRVGLVHRAALDDHPDMSNCEVYACGAPAMVDAARADFTAQAGLPPDRFFADAFLSQRDRVASGTSVAA